MKTKIPIKKYVLDDTTKDLIEEFSKIVSFNFQITAKTRRIAEEYKKLEAHHQEETAFLIKRIEELENQWEELISNSKALNE